jgi:IS30 family transposase
MEDYVRDKLGQYGSPEQIAGRLRYEHPDRPDRWVSHECIYQWIARQKAVGASWHTFLRQGRRKRRRRGRPETRGQVVGRVGIEQRPAEVDHRMGLTTDMAATGVRELKSHHPEPCQAESVTPRSS